MAKKQIAKTGYRTHFGPENPRQSMESSDMEPDDARKFIHDLVSSMHSRMRQLPEEEFKSTSPKRNITANSERAKQYYGNDCYQFFSGIQAALREWDESGRGIEELKEKYGGRFVDGVEIGAKLAVYEGRDFEFVEGADQRGESDGKFTFVQ